MKIRIVAVGKPRDAAIAAAIGEYERRAARYWPLEVHEVRAEPGREGSVTAVQARESDRLFERSIGQIVACD